MLERLLAGLVPIRARSIDYCIAEIEGREILLHLEIAAQLEGVVTTPLNLVGVAEEALFWKDIRRVLFSGSTYRVFSRISRTGVHDSWTPVKLENVLRRAIPGLSESFETFNSPALMATPTIAAESSSAYRTEMATNALSIYARDTADALRRSLPNDFELEAVQHTDWGDVELGLQERRELFSRVTTQLEELFDVSIIPTGAAHRRTVALVECGMGLDGRLSAHSDPQPTVAVPASDVPRQKFIDVELVAVYW